MMMNLFSIFDLSTSPPLSLNWLSMLIFLLILPYQFWFYPSRITYFWNLFINFIFNEFKILISYSFSNIIIFLSLILFIFFNNFMGLFPYIFTASSHMSFCFSLSFSLWMSLILFSIINYLNNLLVHLTPLGSPFMLMLFMVIIKSISLFIRPFTLAIHLTANMIAGHLLLTLLGSSGTNITNPAIFLILISTQILLYILEIAVSLIQAYSQFYLLYMEGKFNSLI